jgi:hypothetical protein
MSDDGPAPAGGPPVGGGGGGGGGNAVAATNGDVSHSNGNGTNEKRFLTKEHFEPSVDEMGHSLSRKITSNSIDLEDYFVSWLAATPRTSTNPMTGWSKSY